MTNKTYGRSKLPFLPRGRREVPSAVSQAQPKEGEGFRKSNVSHPDKIEQEIMSAFEILFHDRYNYPERSVRFYAEFVGIHPSMMPTVERYNYFFDWKAINQKHNKFLKKLNYCHSVRNKSKIKLSELDSARNAPLGIYPR
ncbi:MAG: hypothetical protein CV045_05905 [Cyanobacteria bacterium M5B4]|nr:MAG: hypothetical protein CV045_05905 [Cyanobacteria bacterium M5B4]